MGIFDSLAKSLGNSVKKGASQLVNNATGSVKRSVTTSVNKAADKAVSNAVTKAQTKEYKVVFNILPKNLEEMKALPEATLKEPYYAAALALAALLQFKDNKEACFEMLEFLNGPTELSTFTKSFISEHLGEADYIPKSYFEGSSPDNDYTPKEPYTCTIYKTSISEDIDEGYMRLFVNSSGADSPREIRMRKKPSTGEWFVAELYLFAGIRKPKSANPWA